MFPLMAIPALVGGAGGVIKGIANATSDRTQQQYNKKKLDELMGLEKSGNLGLTGKERGVIGESVYAPAAQAAAEARTRAEQLAAAGQKTTGADLVQSQQAQAGQNALAKQKAAQVVNAANMQKEAQQKNEIEARLAEKSRMASRDVNQIADPIVQLAGAGGQAGADMATKPVEQPFTPEQIQQLLRLLGPSAASMGGPPSLAAGFGR